MAILYLKLPKPTVSSGLYKFHIGAYIKNLQKSRVWKVKVVIDLNKVPSAGF